jgi:hypothetical protein
MYLSKLLVAIAPQKNLSSRKNYSGLLEKIKSYCINNLDYSGAGKIGCLSFEAEGVSANLNVILI